MNAMTEYISLVTALISAVLVLRQFPSLWRALPAQLFIMASRHARRRKRLRLYRRAKMLAARPQIGLADLGAAGAMMLLGVFFELLLFITASVRREFGPPLGWADGLNMIVVFLLIGVSFFRILSLPSEIRQAPARAYALRIQLRRHRYPSLRKHDDENQSLTAE